MSELTPELIAYGVFAGGIGLIWWKLKVLIVKVDSLVSNDRCQERLANQCRKIEDLKKEDIEIWDKLNHHGHSCCVDKDSRVMITK